MNRKKQPGELQKKKPPSSDKKAVRTYMRYAGLGAEMLAMLGIATWAGYKLDGWLHLKLPVFLLIFPLAALAVFLWKIIKATSKRNG